MAKKVGVILSGCGVFDGAEVHESVLTMLALDRRDVEMVICAPDVNQLHVVNHHTGEEVPGETRNVRVEAARIARGPVQDVKDVDADSLDALVLPGGFGAAKNLCDFAVKGADCTVNEGVAALVRAVHEKKKPIAAICIAPALMAKVLGASSPALTIGTDEDTASQLQRLGAKHVTCPVTDRVIDHENKIISTPAYMLAQRVSEAAEGIDKTIETLLEMCD
jgi:enhancing lycopene biosynthesis protein 2